jgi:hypothetical protein
MSKLQSITARTQTAAITSRPGDLLVLAINEGGKLEGDETQSRIGGGGPDHQAQTGHPGQNNPRDTHRCLLSNTQFAGS